MHLRRVVDTLEKPNESLRLPSERRRARALLFVRASRVRRDVIKNEILVRTGLPRLSPVSPARVPSDFAVCRRACLLDASFRYSITGARSAE